MDKKNSQHSQRHTPPAAPALPDDREWFARVVETTEKLVYRRIRRMISDHHTAEDLTQNTFLKAWNARKDFDRTKDEQPWILRIAERVAADHLRSAMAKKRGRPISLHRLKSGKDGNDCDSLEPADSQQRSPLDGLILSEAHAAALLAIEKLPPHERELFGYQQAGLPSGEIAQLSGKTENATNIALHRIRKKLCSLLVDYEIN